MKMQDVKEIAKSRGIKAGKLNKGELVRSIQADEGNEACYETGQAAVCGQESCIWRDDCK
ncbi:SAP domain-containing protein [Geobacter argillaceus]|uniref:Uncharacterized protein n=1 Tax=Geobacter argillaceus TaxID=345631 RepID=A0A562WQN3_9BACT|nr:SAP domain-containing protein [Geobacter argillaceus]TWJ32660.1 hypothetical protein JN12_00635 [Geobacter argillaceus]